MAQDDIQNGFRFMVLLDPTDAFIPRELAIMALEFAPGAFKSCTGLGGELEVTTYAEGGRNDYVHQLPVRHSWTPIRLTKGIARDASLFAWYEAGLYGSLGARRDGAIVMLNSTGLPSMVWTFTGGLASSWTGPEFTADQDALALESLEIKHEGVKSVPLLSLTGVA